MDERTAHRLLTMSEEVRAEVASQTGKAEALAAVVGLAARVLPAVDMSSISVGYETESWRTVVSSAPPAQRADEIQYEEGTGPCVDAARGGQVVITADVANDYRWPTTGPRAAAETGLHSVMSTQLMMSQDGPAGLNLYSADVGAFGDEDALLVPVFAVHAATALEAVSARELTMNLERALQTSREIGTALGILMSSFKIRSEEAFELLRIASQGTHRKLVDIAREVVETGTLQLPERPARNGGSAPRRTT